MTDTIVVARPYFRWQLSRANWEQAEPPEHTDAKFVSSDGHHELYIGILLAPSDPSRAAERLDRVTRDFFESNSKMGPCRVVDSHFHDEPGPTNDAGFVLDFGSTVLRRRVQSVLMTPGAFGEPGRFQVLANVALYSRGPGLADGAHRFEEALRGLSVAPGASACGLGGGIDAFDDATARELLIRPIHRRELEPYTRLLATRGITDPTRGLWPLGHDVFAAVVHADPETPWLLGTMLDADAADLGVLYEHLLACAVDNVGRRVDELVGQRHRTPGGQTVFVFHGWFLSAAAMLLPILQPSLAEQLATSRVLACFPRPDLAAVFADGSPAQREDARAFVMAGAGEVTLSDEIFELTGTGGARPLARG